VKRLAYHAAVAACLVALAAIAFTGCAAAPLPDVHEQLAREGKLAVIGEE